MNGAQRGLPESTERRLGARLRSKLRQMTDPRPRGHGVPATRDEVGKSALDSDPTGSAMPESQGWRGMRRRRCGARHIDVGRHRQRYLVTKRRLVSVGSFGFET